MYAFFIFFSLIIIVSCGSEEQTPPSEPSSPNKPIYTDIDETVPTNPDPGGIVSKKSEDAEPSTTETTVEEIDSWTGPTITLLVAENSWGDRWAAKITTSKGFIPDGYSAVLVHQADDEPTECNDENVTDISITTVDLGVYNSTPGTWWFRVCMLDNATGKYSPGKSKSYEVTE